MRQSDYPLLGDGYWKVDRQQGQYNRSARDGHYLLPKIIEEFGHNPFTEEDYRDSFYAYVPTSGSTETSRKLNVMAALESLVGEEYINEDDGSFTVTDLGYSFADQITDDRPLIKTDDE